MTVAETISQKVVHLPIRYQEEILELVEQIEVRHKNGKTVHTENNGTKHALTLIAEMAVDMGVTDLADRHDFYAHGKLED